MVGLLNPPIIKVWRVLLFLFLPFFFLTGILTNIIFFNRNFDQFYFLGLDFWPEIRASFFRKWIKRKKLAKKVFLFL